MNKLQIFNLSSAIIISLSLSSCLPAAIIGGAGLATYTVAQERTFGDAIDDAAIEARLNALFLGHENQKQFFDVGVESVEGRVLLTGNVPTREAKVEAYNIAWEPNAVKEVINELKVVNEYKFSAKELAKDTWISTQIRSNLLFTKNILSRNYSIETIEGVVYIMGVAQDKAELNRVSSIASQVSGVKKVVSYVRLKEEKPYRKINGNSEVNRTNINNIAEDVYGSNSGTSSNNPNIKVIGNDEPIIIEDISKDYNSNTKSIKSEVIEQENNNLKYYRKPLVEDLPSS